MSSMLKSSTFPVVEQADQMVASAMEAYRSLEEFSRTRQNKRQLKTELNKLHARIDALVQNGLSTQFLPIREMAIQASTWSAISDRCAKVPDDFGDINTLISECLSYESELRAAVAEYDLQKKYWDSQAARRSELESFLGPDEKPQWDLQTLQIAMRATMSPYYKALSEATATNYVDAIPYLEQAWSQFQNYKKINDGIERRAAEFEELPKVARARLKLKQIERLGGLDGSDEGAFGIFLFLNRT